MKKTLIALFVITAVALSVSSYGLGPVNVKKKSCEAACDKADDECMKKSEKEFEQGKDSAKKKANDLACSKAKDECYKKCK